MASITHPLDPLTAAEVERAWESCGGAPARAAGPGHLRHAARARQEGRARAPAGRRGRAGRVRGARRPVPGKTYEAVVSLSQGRVMSWEHVPGVQPAIMLDEFVECEEAVSADPALAGGHAQARRHGRRASYGRPLVGGQLRHPGGRGAAPVRALTWVAPDAQDNGYARPVEDVIVRRRPERDGGRRVEDHGVVPLPPERRQLRRRRQSGTSRPDLKPLEISQPEGPSFAVDGPRGPLAEVALPHRLHAARGPGAAHGRLRGQAARAADPLPRLGREMVVPYGDPRPTLLPQERLRRRRVRHRHAGQLADARLRLPGRDPLLRRRA